MSDAKSESREGHIAAVLDEISMRILDGKPVDFEAVLASNPEIADQLRELESTVSDLAAWGSHTGPQESHGEFKHVLGDFRIIRELGRGGMGVVYEAEQLSLNRRVALKVLPFATLLDERQLRRFQTEARAAAILQHENIVSVYSVGCERGVHYYAMQLIDGFDLAEVIADLREPQLTNTTSGEAVETRTVAKLSTQRSENRSSFYRSVAELGVRVARALEYAHDEGVVHRDIKPANLLLDRQGRIHIADFGLARIRSSHHDLTGANDVLGTLRYMSPEQVTGGQVVDHRSDIYSLGATLYELLTANPAFPGGNRQQLIQAVLNDEPDDPQVHDANAPRDLITVIQKAMAKEPLDRYQNSSELAEDLKRFTNHLPVKARPVTQLERMTKFARRNPVLASFVLTTVALLAILSVSSAALAWKFSADANSQAAAANRRERGIYAGDMRLARIALEEGDLIDAEQQLLKWAPVKGNKAGRDLRGWEWYHLWERCHDPTIEHTFSHRLKAGPVAFSPDGTKLFDGFFSSHVPVWDLNGSKPQLWKKLRINAPNSTVSKTVGDRLIVGDWSGNVSIWDWKTGDRICEIMTDSRSIVRSVDLSVDHDLLAIGVRSPNGESQVILWDIRRDQKRFQIAVEPGKPSVAFDATGQLLVSSDQSNRLSKLNPFDGKVVDEKICDGNVSVMTSSRDRSRVAICVAELSGVKTSRLEVLDIELDGFSSVFHCSLGPEAVTCLSFRDTGDEITAGDASGNLHQVTLTTESVRTHRYHFGPVAGVSYAPDGKRLASGGWDCQTHLIHCDENTHPFVSAGGLGVTRLQREDPVVGYHVGFLDDTTVCTTEGPRYVHLWNVDDGEIRKTITLDEGPWNTIRIGADSERKRLVIVRCNWPMNDRMSEVLVWDGHTGKLIPKRYSIPEAAGTVIPISDSGRYVGVPGRNHTTIVDLAEERTRTIEFSSWVKSCAFSHDEKMIACASTDGPVRFFEVESLVEARRPIEMDHTSTGCIMFAPRSNVLGSTGFDRRFHLFDLDQEKELVTGAQCPRYLSTLSFSPDGRRVATGSMDGRVRLFSTVTGDELFSVDVMPYYTYVSFSPDGESLAIASGTENIVVRAPNQQKLSNLSRTVLDEIVCRDLTQYESN